MKLHFSFSGKRLAFAVILAGLITLGAFYFESSPKFMLFYACIFIAGGLLRIKLSGQKKAAWIIYGLYILSMAAAAGICVTVTQRVNDAKIFLSAYKFFLGAEAALIFISFVCAAEALISKKLSPWGIISASGLLLLLGLTNYYLFTFRGNALSPLDFLSLGTAVNFVGKYEYEITRFIFNGVTIYLAAAFLLSGVQFDIQLRKAVRTVCPLVLSLLLAFSLSLSFKRGLVHSYYHSNGGCVTNGLLLNFVLQLENCFITEPEEYSALSVEQAENDYPANTYAEKSPNIIVIVNESFADHRIYGDIKTDVPIMSFFDSLKENTIKGYALSSVYGGMTPNSEFEFLTGHSMGFLPPYSVPFQQYITAPIFSLEHYLETLGYTSYAVHPFGIENWSRFKIYPYLGFDNYSFDEAFVSAETFDYFVSDRALYEHIIKQYDSMGKDSKKFIYSLSIQNHSAYTLTGRDEAGVSSAACNSLEADVYFSRILESNRALEYLLDHFESADEPVVILMFGDHQPNFSEEMLSALRGSSDNSLDSQMLRYTVPFVLWTNYDIEEQQVELSSLNFLSNYLLETAGLPLSPYNSFLKDVQQTVPAINAHGYYSLSEGRFKPISEAEGAEKDILHRYEILQYNALFDEKGRSALLFPLADK